MLEKALTGGRRYWTLIGVLGVIAFIGTLFYLRQLDEGLGITGLSRDVSWGFYIAQFTFLVGVAASAVMVVLPYYLHNYKLFGKITILGEFLAVASVMMCVTFIIVDLGSNHGIQSGMILSVHRDDKFLGKVQAEKVYEDMCAATILPNWTSRNIEEGDKAVLGN